MSTIQERLQNVRTLEDVVNLLTILFTNLNNQNEMYYNMFLNPEPMDIDLERYDENGNLTTVKLANRAKDKILTYSGKGNPNGRQIAVIGSLYIDTNSGDLYYKTVGIDSYGWTLVWTTRNLKPETNYLTPDGNGSHLTNLNASNITTGTLAVTKGGTGVNSITGLIKGNGTSAFSVAEANEDYVAPNSLVGMVMYSPVASLPSRSLICDGTVYSISERPELTNLLNKLKNAYGGNGITTFGVPNLIGRYIKGGTPSTVGTTGNANIGEHYHRLIGSTSSESQHKHDAGTLNITGYADLPLRRTGEAKGAFYYTNTTLGRTDTSSNIQDNSRRLNLSASNGWDPNGLTGSGSSHSHSLEGLATSTVGSGVNDVDHIVMIPIIRY